eukprot:UN25737
MCSDGHSRLSSRRHARLPLVPKVQQTSIFPISRVVSSTSIPSDTSVVVNGSRSLLLCIQMCLWCARVKKIMKNSSIQHSLIFLMSMYTQQAFSEAPRGTCSS